MPLVAVAALKPFKQNTPTFPNTDPHLLFCLSGFSLPFSVHAGSLFLSILLTLSHKAPEGNWAKVELSFGGEVGKDSELAKVVLSGLEVRGGKAEESHWGLNVASVTSYLRASLSFAS